MEKRPIDIDLAMDSIREAIRPFPKAAMFQLFDEGYTTPFEQLIACMISIRTRDETTVPVAHRFFARARRPEDVSRLSSAEIDELISMSSFQEAKAGQIREIARIATEKYGGELPCDRDVLLSLPGIGPKCANLVLGIACGQPHIGVDIHVHRVTNRWGYVRATTPEATMAALEAKLPERYWVEVNRLLVPFGKHVCTGHLPHCSTCPVLDMCHQVGVAQHR